MNPVQQSDQEEPERIRKSSKLTIAKTGIKKAPPVTPAEKIKLAMWVIDTFGSVEGAIAAINAAALGMSQLEKK